MAPPVINGEPKIVQDTKSNSLKLEVTVSGTDPSKTKWFFNEKEIEANESITFTNQDQGGKRTLFRCEIMNFVKDLAGEYKAHFFNNDGTNVASFNVKVGDAPEFYDKPHIVQRDGGNIIIIKVRAKSNLEIKAEWYKDDKLLKATDRIKALTKPDDKDKDGQQFLLEITTPEKNDEGKYRCVVKNAEGQNEQSLNLCFD